MKARSIARELALLGISQLTDNPDKVTASTGKERGQPLPARQLDALLMKALKALSADAGETLATADGELQRGERFILESETRTIERDEVRSRIQPALPLVESAINQAGETLELLIFAQQGDKQKIMAARNELISASAQVEKGNQLLIAQAQRTADIDEARKAIQLAITLTRSVIAKLQESLSPGSFSKIIDHADIRSYSCDLLYHWITHWRSIDKQLDEAMEKWNMRRLARVDRDILRLAMLEIVYMQVPTKVAIDEAIEMAKRYSDEEGYRFINGVLRRATDKLNTANL